MAQLIANAKTFFRSEDGVDRLARLGHRISGLGVVLFFLMHVVDTSFVYFWPQGYERTLRLFQSPFFLVGEIVLVVAVIYHGINGLRTALTDWSPHLRRHRQALTLGAFGLAALLAIPAVIIMGGHVWRVLQLIRGG